MRLMPFELLLLLPEGKEKPEGKLVTLEGGKIEVRARRMYAGWKDRVGNSIRRIMGTRG